MMIQEPRVVKNKQKTEVKNLMSVFPLKQAFKTVFYRFFWLKQMRKLSWLHLGKKNKSFFSS